MLLIAKLRKIREICKYSGERFRIIGHHRTALVFSVFVDSEKLCQVGKMLYLCSGNEKGKAPLRFLIQPSQEVKSAAPLPKSWGKKNQHKHKTNV